jgi:hypothetical protein
MSNTSNYRISLKRNGYDPIPIKAGTKRPPMDEWPRLADATAEDIQEWDQRYSNAPGTGIILGNVGVIDLDVMDAAAAAELRETARDWLKPFGKVIVRIGKSPKCGILFRTETPFSKRAHAYQGGHKLELLCQGQQAVIDGIHPDTGKPYEFEHGITPEEIPAHELPLLDEKGAVELLDYLDEILRQQFHFEWLAAKANSNADTDDPERAAFFIAGSNKLDIERWLDAMRPTGESVQQTSAASVAGADPGRRRLQRSGRIRHCDHHGESARRRLGLDGSA